ncbi:hypothetical protein GUITHDRAFT_110251 [Guillardia theta CCMP2712]|uniref:Uncharacterized protein n=1 Tax=Guillardia theta (strain CCMP2712) TaxID=905079 RepID=L1J674_GUITC|nr:hypothetical protein GUITHDRAFT_110251 [Guillardia theta CCMP2712]EKX43797.1 hypothetical protein GUITHDRAFT_110251 [Guillardia theta CCMP2712]|eukprot:XP_005830777.1 hypothetical protein GUITHDRAFT_110251 [Guillardia theta CCMP2712]
MPRKMQSMHVFAACVIGLMCTSLYLIHRHLPRHSEFLQQVQPHLHFTLQNQAMMLGSQDFNPIMSIPTQGLFLAPRARSLAMGKVCLDSCYDQFLVCTSGLGYRASRYHGNPINGNTADVIREKFPYCQHIYQDYCKPQC